MRLPLYFAICAGAVFAQVDFVKQVQPILEKHCTSCHGGDRGAGGLKLTTKANAARAISTSEPAKSPLLRTMETPAGQPLAMPPGGPQVPSAERDVIRQWLAAGAQWPEGVEIGKAPARAKDDEALAAKIAARIQPNGKFEPYQNTIPNTVVTYEMVPVPGGEFTMGTLESEKGRLPDEGPQRKIKVAPFWMGKFEVTWDEYRFFMFQNLANEKLGADAALDAVSRPTKPYVEMSFGMGINGFPAISMTQHAANKYAQWLSAKTGHFYRLPTEAEWEYACRAGQTESGNLNDIAWYVDNSPEKYQQVGKKKPNSLGLYDMLGNVAEWTLDQYDPKAYTHPLPAAGYEVSKTPYPHVSRGGGWSDDATRLRCGARLGSDASWKMQDPQLPKSIWYLTDAQFQGFRLVRPLKTPSPAEMFRYWNNGVARE
ncbi:MAG TPA: SUMF1/EgtB/PvdO family nonheme iron enzyme [Bryobacteraceae bacterium]|nr:SUMF1/EgtB/PvdO family nonheme iron enzyme [Bryobacteraceae bacterium]